MGTNDKERNANSNDQRPPSINRRAVLRGAVATGATGGLAGCLGSFKREYEATPATVPEETASEHDLDPDPEVKKRSGTITQGLGVATIEADVTGYTTTYEYQGDEQQTEAPTAESVTTPTPTPEPPATPTPTPTPEPTPTPTETQTAPEKDDDDGNGDGDDDGDGDGDGDGDVTTPGRTGQLASIEFTDKKLQSTEDGFVAVVDGVKLGQGGFVALRKGNLNGDVLGVSKYLSAGEHFNVRVRLDEPIVGDVTLVAVAQKDDGNTTFDPSTDQAYTKNGQPISDSAVVQLPDEPSVGPVEPDTLNINSTPNPNFVGQSLNPAATTSIETLIEEETEAFEQACNCTIEKPSQVKVKSVDPADAQLSEDDIGKTVFHLDKESEVLSDVPKTTELLGDEKPIELFLIPSSGEKENALRTELVAATKTTGQLKSGSNEAVVASYISNNLHFTPQVRMAGYELLSIDTSKAAVGTPTPTETPTPTATPASDQGDAGLITTSQVKKTADQLSGVCPSVTGGARETITPTPNPTPTPTPTPFQNVFEPGQMLRYPERLAKLADKHNNLTQKLREVKGKWEARRYGFAAQRGSESGRDEETLNTVRELGYHKKETSSDEIGKLTEQMQDIERQLDEVNVAIENESKRILANVEGKNPGQLSPELTEYKQRQPVLDACGIDGPAQGGPNADRINTKIEWVDIPTGVWQPRACECEVTGAEVEFCIDCPKGWDTGHAYLRVTYSVSCECEGLGETVKTPRFKVEKGWGLYPSGVRDDTNRPCDKVVATASSLSRGDAEFTVKDAQNLTDEIQKQMKKIQSDKKDSPYFMWSNNCIDWAIRLWKKYSSDATARWIDSKGDEPDVPHLFCLTR